MKKAQLQLLFLVLVGHAGLATSDALVAAGSAEHNNSSSTSRTDQPTSLAQSDESTSNNRSKRPIWKRYAVRIIVIVTALVFWLAAKRFFGAVEPD